MNMQSLANGQISLQVSRQGAELLSVVDNTTGYEYMWQGDPSYWKRTSPVLFPIVGALRGGRYTYDGHEYQLPKHGFARDLLHDVISTDTDALGFVLHDSSITQEHYPFHFELETRYKLSHRTLQIQWLVRNLSDNNMYFSIGAHPAFNCDFSHHQVKVDFSNVEATDLPYRTLNNDGLCLPNNHNVALDGGRLKLTSELFSNDALIVSNENINQATLTINGVDYARLRFDTPLFGLWSPAGKDAPFVCIEPWYGRCDGVDADGDLTRKPYIMQLSPSNVWSGGYSIEFLQIKSA